MQNREMTAAQWKKAPRDFKTIVNGVRMILTNDPKTGGTVLVPVTIIPAAPKCRWFAMCSNDATTTRPGFAGPVDICERCDAKMNRIDAL